jgi:DNA-binding IclR family transcriptional regulator
MFCILIFVYYILLLPHIQQCETLPFMKQIRTIPSFQKGLRVLQYIAEHPDGLDTADIQELPGVPASNLSLYLNTLVVAGFTVRDPVTKKFFLAPEVAESFTKPGSALIHRLDAASEKSMQTLHSQFNENVLLGFRQEQKLFFIRHLVTTHRLQIQIEPNPEYPLHVVAAGRAILAFLPNEEIDRYIRKTDFPVFTKRTVDNADSLHTHLEQTRKNGFDFNPGEFEDDIMATAAPIMFKNYPVASLVVQFPRIRYTEQQAFDAGILIKKEAAKIEQEISK